MLGLIKKDFLMMRGNLRFLLVILVVFCIVSFTGNGNYSFIPSFISVMLLMSTFSYDEYNQWDLYAITLPGGRKNVIYAKYVSSVLLILLCSVLSSVYSLGIGLVKANISLEEVLFIPLGTFFAILFFLAIILPIIFKFGVEKGRIGLFVIVFGFTGIVSLCFKYKLSIPISILNFLENYGLFVLPVVAVFFFGVSYMLSQRIYAKKEF